MCSALVLSDCFIFTTAGPSYVTLGGVMKPLGAALPTSIPPTMPAAPAHSPDSAPTEAATHGHSISPGQAGASPATAQPPPAEQATHHPGTGGYLPSTAEVKTGCTSDEADQLGHQRVDSKHDSLAACHKAAAVADGTNNIGDSHVSSGSSTSAELSDSTPHIAFLPSTAFAGAKAGFAFKLGHMGLGYYPDRVFAQSATACKACSIVANGIPLKPCSPCAIACVASADSAASAADSTSAAQSAEEAKEGEAGETHVEHPDQAERPAPADDVGKTGEEARPEGTADVHCDHGHYWGQALQYLDRAVQVCTTCTASASHAFVQFTFPVT